MSQNDQPTEQSINPEIERLIADANNRVSQVSRQLEAEDEVMRSLGVDPRTFDSELEDYLSQNPDEKAEAQRRLKDIELDARRQVDANGPAGSPPGNPPGTPRAPKRRMMI